MFPIYRRGQGARPDGGSFRPATDEETNSVCAGGARLQRAGVRLTDRGLIGRRGGRGRGRRLFDCGAARKTADGSDAKETGDDGFHDVGG